MTKIVKFWMRFSFWNKLRALFTALGVGGEFALFVGDSHHGYKIFVGIMTALAIGITHLIEDSNKDGIVDMFQDDKDLK
jgi:hypothetical protein